MRDAMLIIHFLGLTMGLGTSFAHAFLGIVTSKMTSEEAEKFRLHSLVLSKMGNVGIVFLVVSGLYLITPFWSALPSLPLLNLKLVLVIALIVLITMINLSAKKAIGGDATAQLKKMESLGKMTLLLGVTIVILAVLVFH